MTAPGGRRQYIEPLPARLIRTPLDFILADHLRHRVLCHLCDLLAAGEAYDRAIAGEVADHIETALSVHIVDEEQDLFPLLRQRAKPEDNIDAVLDRLSEEHDADELHGGKIVAGLRRLIADPDKPMPKALRRTLRAFASNERRHLALENAIVMPLARVRLSVKDLESLAGAMAARRGLPASQS